MNENQLLSVIELLAHKVKNPSHSIGLNLEVLKSQIQKLDAKNAADLNKNAAIIASEIDRLNLIIERFVQYMTPAGREKKRVKLTNLLKLTRSLVEPIAREKGIQLEFQSPGKEYPLNINPDEICGALKNLITNAIEASKSGDKIQIRVDEKPKGIMITVEDNGCGVTADNGPKIFDICYSTKKKQLGMGLPLARKIIEENGGTIRMRTAAQKGTQVFISLPL